MLRIAIGLVTLGALSIFLPATRLMAQAQPVSYGREVAPIFAFHCAGCHGLSNPSANFRVTTFRGLRAGGEIGDEIVPGHPEESAILDFLEGRRGPGQRMPQSGQPLSTNQIDLIRRWIGEGAQNDHARSPCFELRIAGVSLPSSDPLEIEALSSVPAFLTFSLRSPSLRRPIVLEEAGVAAPREGANIASPGEWIHWSLRRQDGWPAVAALNLRFQYSSDPPKESVLRVSGDGLKKSTTALKRLNCGPS